MGRVRLRESDIQDLMAMFKKYRQTRGIMAACEKVAEAMSIDPDTVYAIQRRFRPTTDIATDYMKGSALKLAMRVVRKANVDQAMNILSRPNIGVLDSPNAGGDVGKGFVIGIAVDGLGGVKVGMQVGTAPEPQALPAAVEEDPEEVLEMEEEEPAPKPQKRWYRPDPRPTPPVIVPVPKDTTRFFGQHRHTRKAIAKVETKALSKRRRLERQAVNARMRELEAQLKGKV